MSRFSVSLTRGSHCLDENSVITKTGIMIILKRARRGGTMPTLVGALLELQEGARKAQNGRLKGDLFADK